jgi:hypothetical protein
MQATGSDADENEKKEQPWYERRRIRSEAWR